MLASRLALAKRLIRLRRDLTDPELHPDSELAAILWQLAASLDYVAGLLRRPQTVGAQPVRERPSDRTASTTVQQPPAVEPLVFWTPTKAAPTVTPAE